MQACFPDVEVQSFFKSAQSEEDLFGLLLQFFSESVFSTPLNHVSGKPG